MQDEPAPIPPHPLGEENLQILDTLYGALRGALQPPDFLIRVFDRLEKQSIVVGSANSSYLVARVVDYVDGQMRSKFGSAVRTYATEGFVNVERVAEIAKNVDEELLFIIDEYKRLDDVRARSGQLAPMAPQDVGRTITNAYFVDALKKMAEAERKTIVAELAQLKQARQAATVAHSAALQEINLLNTRIAAVFNARLSERKTTFQQAKDISSVQTDSSKALARYNYYTTLATAEVRRKNFEIAYLQAISGIKTENGEYLTQLGRMQQASDAVTQLSTMIVDLYRAGVRRTGNVVPPPLSNNEYANLMDRANRLVEQHTQRRGEITVRPYKERLENHIRPLIDKYVALIDELDNELLAIDVVEHKSNIWRIARELDIELTEWFADMQPTVFLDDTQKALVKASVEPLIKMQQSSLVQFRSEVLNKSYEAQLTISALDSSIAEMHIKFARIRTWMAKWRAAQLLDAPRIRHDRCTYTPPNDEVGSVQCGRVGDLCSAILVEARYSRGTVSVTCCARHREVIETKFRDNIVHDVMYMVVSPDVFMWQCLLQGVVTN